MKLNNLSIRAKLQALVGFAVLILVSLGTFNLIIQKESSYEQRKDRVRSNVEIAYALANHYKTLSKSIGETQAKEAAAKAIEELRYDGNNYFFIATSDENIVMHPTNPKLNGTNASNLTDSRGNYFWQE